MFIIKCTILFHFFSFLTVVDSYYVMCSSRLEKTSRLLVDKPSSTLAALKSVGFFLCAVLLVFLSLRCVADHKTGK